MAYPGGAAADARIRGAASVDVLHLAANRERSLMALLTPRSLSVLAAHPLATLVTHNRAEADVSERGLHARLLWKPDSTALCVTTSKNALEIYRVISCPSGSKGGGSRVYVQKESCDPSLRRTSQDLFVKDELPGVSLSLSLVVRLSSPSSSVLALREELVVCLEDGYLHRIQWSGQVLEELSFHLSKLPFAHDQLQSKPGFVEARSGKLFVRDAAYSPLIGGFSIVLSNGRAALLTSPTPKFHPSKVLGVWAGTLSDALVTAVNHKYRLLSFGTRSGHLVAFTCDENTGALALVYRVSLSSKENPELVREPGGVRAMAWSPYGTAVALTFTKSPAIALFSVFGAQLWSSAEALTVTPERESRLGKALEWGPEGFQLLLGDTQGLRTMPMLRPAAVNNPVMEDSSKVVLVWDGGVMLSPERELEEGAPAPAGAWTRLQLPCDYLAANWPLRYAVVSGEIVLVAGTRGLAHTALTRLGLSQPKWRLFGNETQEREIVVSGGLGIWQGFAVAACYDVERNKDEFRFYPLKWQLDNLYASKLGVEAQIMSMSMKDNILVAFDVEARISLYALSVQGGAGEVPRVRTSRIAEVLISDVVFHPACVINVHLTNLNHDQHSAEFCAGADTLLVNVAGRLIMLSPQRASRLSPNAALNNSHQEAKKPQQLQQPMLIASYVEQVWHEPVSNPSQGQLSQSLWLQCGSRGMKVWLPLCSKKGGGNIPKLGAVPGPVAGRTEPPSFISKRIMLPFELDVMPLVMRSEECVGVGVEAVSSNSGTWSPNRTSGLFLHHILKQLLKRNLGLYALEIAASCRGLAYFAHVMELLLHNVLEEETTSSEPIPDPLLPRVVAFIQEFPEFLKTVAHCARKTEQTHWHHLFASAGAPADLFEAAVKESQLATAASFLIVLQNMEAPSAAKEHALQLLQASLQQCKWSIAREIVRFLKAIDPDDIDSPPRTPMYGKTSGPSGMPKPSLASPTEDADAFVFQNLGRISRARQSSLSSPPAASPKESGKEERRGSRKSKTPLSKTTSGSEERRLR